MKQYRHKCYNAPVREFSQKRKMNRYMYSFPVLFILFIILFFTVKGSVDVYKKYSFSKAKLDNSSKELAVLEEKKQKIVKKIDNLDTETGIEKEIRSKFNVAKDGEKVIVIVDDGVKEEVVEEEKGFMGNFLTTIGGWFQ